MHHGYKFLLNSYFRVTAFDSLAAVIDVVYDGFADNYASVPDLAARAIVSPLSTCVDKINAPVLLIVPSPSRE